MTEMLSDYIKSEEFNRFCNIFLIMEVSALVEVYDSPGAMFDAQYLGPTTVETDGIFQYKFSFG